MPELREVARQRHGARRPQGSVGARLPPPSTFRGVCRVRRAGSGGSGAVRPGLAPRQLLGRAEGASSPAALVAVHVLPRGGHPGDGTDGDRTGIAVLRAPRGRRWQRPAPRSANPPRPDRRPGGRDAGGRSGGPRPLAARRSGPSIRLCARNRWWCLQAASAAFTTTCITGACAAIPRPTRRYRPGSCSSSSLPPGQHAQRRPGPWRQCGCLQEWQSYVGVLSWVELCSRPPASSGS